MNECVQNVLTACLLVGMHASISAHISNEYLTDEASDTWGQSLEEFTQRLGNTAVKERVENMYFTYLFVLRAVMKAGPLLESVDYSTGFPEQDLHTKQLMQQLVGPSSHSSHALVAAACSNSSIDRSHEGLGVTLPMQKYLSRGHTECKEHNTFCSAGQQCGSEIIVSHSI